MSWVRLDDQFFLNPKAVAAGKDGRELFLAGLCYCASQLTDGFIASAAVPLIAAQANVKPSTARLLESIGWWEETIGGWWVHNYLEFNPRASEVRAARVQRAEAGRRGGKQRAVNLLAARQAAATTNGSDA